VVILSKGITSEFRRRPGSAVAGNAPESGTERPIVPSVSDKQHRFMEAVKHNPDFAEKVGVPQRVGADFVAADKNGPQLQRAMAHRLRAGKKGGRTPPGRKHTEPDVAREPDADMDDRKGPRGY
jgi:hypothetical protein